MDQKPFARLAKEAGLDPDRLLADMKSPQVEQRIQEDVALADKLKVRGTPMVFLDGRVMLQWSTIRIWQEVLSVADGRPRARIAPPGPR